MFTVNQYSSGNLFVDAIRSHLRFAHCVEYQHKCNVSYMFAAGHRWPQVSSTLGNFFIENSRGREGGIAQW